MQRYQRMLLLFYPAVVVGFSVLGDQLPRWFSGQQEGVANGQEEEWWRLSAAPPWISALVDKRGFVNVYFVKLGWLWTVVPLLLLWWSSSVWSSSNGAAAGPPPPPPSLLRRLVYASGYWFVFTQWFVGDRSLLARIHQHYPWAYCTAGEHAEHDPCRAHGHRWVSFDTSGHCFLLVHASLLLWEELRSFMHYHYNRRHRNTDNTDNYTDKTDADNTEHALLRHAKPSRSRSSSPKSSSSSSRRRDGNRTPQPTPPPPPYTVRTGAMVLVTAILFLWLWMLIVTCLLYHTWGEKLLGTLFGYGYWWLVGRWMYHGRTSV